MNERRKGAIIIKGSKILRKEKKSMKKQQTRMKETWKESQKRKGYLVKCTRMENNERENQRRSVKCQTTKDKMHMWEGTITK